MSEEFTSGGLSEIQGLEPEGMAAELGGHIGRDAGPRILEMARAHLLASAGRSGGQTTEFRLSLLLVIGGLTLVGMGVYASDGALQQQGVDLLKYVGAGYAISRGIAKAGAAKLQTPPQQ